MIKKGKLALVCAVVLLFTQFDYLYLHWVTFLVVSRGILSPNCFWWKVSELCLQDSSGIWIYNRLRERSGSDNFDATLFGNDIHIVGDLSDISLVMKNSPNVYTVGKLKKQFFASFMSKNVGVSSGNEWRHRRIVNENVLFIDRLHKYANTFLNKILKESDRIKKAQTFNDFLNISKTLCFSIVFAEKFYESSDMHQAVFNVFSEANSMIPVVSNKGHITEKTMKLYTKYLKQQIKKKRMEVKKSECLLSLAIQQEDNEEELIHNIPHWIFPIVGLFAISAPRVLLLILESGYKPFMLNALKTVDIRNAPSIYSCEHLRFCILETMRLMNPVVTTYRHVTTNAYTGKEIGNKKKKGDCCPFQPGKELLILNNAVLRDPRNFDKPNHFIPERWLNNELEHRAQSISWNQGPQRCPGKELSIFLIQAFIAVFMKLRPNYSNETNSSVKLISDDGSISQMISPCSIRIL